MEAGQTSTPKNDVQRRAMVQMTPTVIEKIPEGRDAPNGASDRSVDDRLSNISGGPQHEQLDEIDDVFLDRSAPARHSSITARKDEPHPVQIPTCRQDNDVTNRASTTSCAEYPALSCTGHMLTWDTRLLNRRGQRRDWDHEAGTQRSIPSPIVLNRSNYQIVKLHPKIKRVSRKSDPWVAWSETQIAIVRILSNHSPLCLPLLPS